MMSEMLEIGGVLALIGLAAAIFVLGALNGAFSHILADEIRAGTPALARRIAQISARRLPEEHREDQLETWLAELAALEARPLMAVRFAVLHCLAAAPALARELRPASAVAVEGVDVEETGGDGAGGPRTTMARLFVVSKKSGGERGRSLARLRSAALGGIAVLVAMARRLADPAGLLRAIAEWELAVLRDFTEQFTCVLRDGAELLAGLLRIVGLTCREVLSLFGPYDYSREWRSVVQLLARILVLVPVIGVAVPLLFVAGSFVFRLVIGS